jgi:hypothetical protein
LERVQAVGLSRRRSRLCRTDYLPCIDILYDKLLWEVNSKNHFYQIFSEIPTYYRTCKALTII